MKLTSTRSPLSHRQSSTWMKRAWMMLFTGFLSVSLPLQAADIVGETKGQLQVSSSGGAGYQIPLAVPAGVNGLQPSVSFNYQSSSQNGLMGVGWSMGGLSSIHRCGNTWFVDGKAQQVQLTEEDNLCLDGQRLYLISGNHWSVNAQYRTNIASFQQIKIISSNPLTYEVRNKSGQILTYGGTSDSRIKATGKNVDYLWAVNSIKDRFDNAMAVKYNQDGVNGNFYPTEISYSDAKITFNYATNRTDAAVRYFAGAKVKTKHSLTQVTTWLQNTKINEYNLGYAYGASTKQLQLNAVTQCGYDEAGQVKQCLAPTSVNWINQLSKFNNALNGNAIKYQYILDAFPLDWNGDGRQDLFTSEQTDGARISISQGNSFTNEKILAATEVDWMWSAVPMDAESDGKHDVLYRKIRRLDPEGTKFKHQWHIIQSDGDKIKIGSAWYVDVALDEIGNQYDSEMVSGYTAPRPIVLEIDGDGLMDLLLPIGKDWQIFRNASYNDTVSFVYEGKIDGVSAKEYLTGESFDVNGDGRHEAIFKKASEEDGNYYVVSFDPDFTKQPGLPKLGDNLPAKKAVSLDVNGDGLMDFAIPKKVGNTDRLHVYLNKGDGSFTTINTNIPTEDIFVDVSQAYTSRTYAVKTLDYNGDGWMDLMYPGESKFMVMLSTGEGFANPIATTVTANPAIINTVFSEEQIQAIEDLIAGLQAILEIPNQTQDAKNKINAFIQMLENLLNGLAITKGINDFHYMDINGDGQQDLIQVDDSENEDGWQVHLQARNLPQWADKFTTGHGAYSRVNYASTTNSSVYTKGNNAVYPEMDLAGPFFVISKAYDSNGIGGERQRTYKYQQAQLNLRGHGFLGMQQQTVTDLSTGIKSVTGYRQDYPYIGRPLNKTVTANNKLIGTEQYTWQQIDLIQGKHHFVQLKKLLSTERELNGTWVSGTKVENTFDLHGNLDHQVVTQGRSLSGSQVLGIEKTVISDPTFNNDANQWLLGFKTQDKVTTSVPGEANHEVVTNYTAVPNTLAVESVTQFPNDAALTLTVSTTRDAQGNPLAITTSGNSIVPRTETIADYLLNRYPQTVSNALNHTSTQSYDLRFGQPKTVTDPNGLTTTVIYDEVGRPIKSVTADGTETLISYTACGQCPQNAVYAVTTEIVHPNEQGDGAPKTIQYMDQYDRVVRQETVSIEGNAIYTDTQYDALGRVAQQSLPYFAGDTVYWTNYQYDSLGRTTLETRADNGKIQTQYSGNNQNGGRKATITTTVIQPDQTQAQQVVTQTFNPLNQLIQTTDALGTLTEMDYDAQGKLNWSRVDGNDDTLTTMVFNAAGHKISITEPNTGTDAYSTNALGEMLTNANAAGDLSEYEYDILGRLVLRVDHYEQKGLDLENEWTYDQGKQGAIGQLTQVTREGFYEEYEYDTLGRLKTRNTEMEGNGQASYSFTYSYDNFSRLDTMTYPSGFAVKQTYSSTGYLEQIKNADDNTVYQTITEQDALGQLTKASYGNGLSTQHAYDPKTGRVQTLKVVDNNQLSKQLLTYQFDTIGNVYQRQDHVADATETFSYDALNRLTEAKTIWQNNNPTRILGYSYDVLGNLKTKTGDSQAALGNYTYGENGAGPHQVTTAGNHAYSYDAAGRMIEGAGRVYDYLEKVVLIGDANTNSVSEFRYSPDGDRYYQHQDDNGSVTHINYVANGLFEERVNKEQKLLEQKSYVGDFLVHTIDINNQETVNYLHRDHLGSVDTITDEAGQVIAKTTFDPHGYRRADDWQEGGQVSEITSRGFTDHEHLDAVGLIHMNGRVYDPALGRFISADPYVQEPTNSQSFNRYTYVWNNPLSFTDPSGYKVVLDESQLLNWQVEQSFANQNMFDYITMKNKLQTLYFQAEQIQNKFFMPNSNVDEYINLFIETGKNALIQSDSSVVLHLNDKAMHIIKEQMVYEADLSDHKFNFIKRYKDFWLADTFLYKSGLLVSRQFSVGDRCCFLGGDINYIAIGVMAARYGYTKRGLEDMVWGWNAGQHVLSGFDSDNMSQIERAIPWALEGYNYYNSKNK